MRRGTLLLAVLPLCLIGCGGGGDSAGSGPLVVSAATSLKAPFTRYAPHARLSFAGSDELAAQIRAGVRPDVFAAANTKLPAALYRAKLVERPTIFATNRLVLAVPRDGHAVRGLRDLERPGVALAIGAATVPVGSYTREVLARLGAARAAAILRNVRSQEPDVGGVVGKLTQGAADAGFVYVTDVRATGGRLRAIELPPRLRPRVRYAAAVVRGSARAARARAFVAGLLGGAGARALRAAGFAPPGR